MRVVLQIDHVATPVSGWLEDAELRRIPFIGFVELIAALEAALAARTRTPE